jgi:hypothetical protein
MKEAQANDYRGCLGNPRPWVLGGHKTRDLMFAGYFGTNSVILQQPGLSRATFPIESLSQEDLDYLKRNFPKKE